MKGMSFGPSTTHLVAALTAWLALLAPGHAQVVRAPDLQPKPRAVSVAGTAGPGASSHALDPADLNAWLDGFMPFALASGDIAGAVVVVVKDGQVLTEKGYGFSNIARGRPVDPRQTLFREGSVSKLFTWTSVMQLVGQGRIDLDRDVNGYLDFRIPAFRGQPITMRELMSHTGGFSEHAKDIIVEDPKRFKSLGRYIKSQLPKRIDPPGTVPAYSNYGAALAGYIVQRVSGEPFDGYVQHHIFDPLGMTRSTFVQPLPAKFVPDMAKGYLLASQPTPRPYELVGPAPAGALAATGEDMGRFMVGHLQAARGAPGAILSPQMAKLMYADGYRPISALPGMALGFYHEDRNGHVIIGHEGDTVAFHSALHLFLNDGVGLFLAVNSPGREDAAESLRGWLFHQFSNRYFPGPGAQPPTWPSAKQDAAKMVGTYISSRRATSSLLRIATLLGQAKVTAAPDGTIQFSAFKNAAGAAKHWREVGPFVWQEVNGHSRLAAKLENGRVAAFTTDDFPPVFVFQPVPASIAASWNLPLLGLTVLVLVLTVLAWPIGVLIRRRYGQGFTLSGRAAWLHRLAKAGAVLDLMLLFGWAQFITKAFGTDVSLLDDVSDPFLRILQVLGLLAIAAAIVGGWNAVVTVRSAERARGAKVWSCVLAAALVAIVWFLLSLDLITPSLSY